MARVAPLCAQEAAAVLLARAVPPAGADREADADDEGEEEQDERAADHDELVGLYSAADFVAYRSLALVAEAN